MNINKLNISIAIKSVILVILITGFIIFNSYFSKIKLSLSTEKINFAQKVKDYKLKINNFNKKTRNITESLEIWDNLGGEGMYFEGVRISMVKEILDNLKNKYEFKELDIKMSKPITLENEYQGKIIAVESSKIDMSVRAYSDVDIMLFLYDLSNISPSYLIIDSYFIKLELSLDQVIEKISNGDDVSSVYAEIKIYWKELKTL